MPTYLAHVESRLLRVACPRLQGGSAEARSYSTWEVVVFDVVILVAHVYVEERT